MSDHSAHAGEVHHSHTKLYLITGAILTAVTMVELAIPFTEAIPDSIGVPALVALAAFKMAGVVAIFMHLKGDANIYKFLFISPLVIAVLMILVLGTMAIRTFAPFSKEQPKLAHEKPKIKFWNQDQLLAGFAKAKESEFTEGKQIYADNCAACHRADGGGQTGPAFTDSCWLHGPSLAEHVQVLHKGVPGTAMVSWQQQLGQEKIRAVAYYIHSLPGTEVPNPKECQGIKH